MNEELARLAQGHEALIGALDANDADAIQAASQELGQALDAVRSFHGWERVPEARSMLERIGGLAETARMRVNLLSDVARRRGEALGVARGIAPAGVYGR